MQIQKSDIKSRILTSAKEEFLEKDFKKASMRVIAKKASVGLSNIYNYFKNKDEIFCALLYPLLNEFKGISEEHNSEENISLDVFYSSEYQTKTLAVFISLVKRRRDDLELLLFKANGSSLENFRDTYTDSQTEIGIEYLRIMKEKYPYINSNISRFFLHSISSINLTIFSEIVSHKELSESEIEEFIEQYVAFSTAGWKKLMGA